MDLQNNENRAVDQNNIKVKSLYKALQILLYFTDEVKELGVTELAEKSGVLKSTISNIMATYEACGFVERNPKTNKFRLGVKVLELSNRFYYNNDIRQVLRPAMEKIADATGESVYLAVIDGEEVIYLDAAFKSTTIGSRNMIGVKAPAYCTGIGKALLAFESDSVINTIIKRGLNSFTPNTITKPERLLEELDRIRTQGYALDDMEHEYGIRCIAVPIRNYEGNVLAAISISGPSLRFQNNRLEELSYLLKQTVEAVRYQLL